MIFLDTTYGTPISSDHPPFFLKKSLSITQASILPTGKGHSNPAISGTVK